MEKIVLLLLPLIAIGYGEIQDPTSKYKIVCYVNGSASHRYGDGNFVVEHIDPTLCTHLIYGFAKEEGGQLVPNDPALELRENFGKGAFERLGILRLLNRDLKIMIGFNPQHDDSRFLQIISETQTRSIFTESSINFCKKHELDGVDILWSPPLIGHTSSNSESYWLLLKELKASFKEHGLILSTSAGGDDAFSKQDVKEISKHVDFINVMAYGLREPYPYEQTRHHAPLHAHEDMENHMKSVIWMVNFWIENGAPKDKIILGMAFFGRSFTLSDVSQHAVGSPTDGKGNQGVFTKQSGILGFNEICGIYLKEGWHEVYEKDGSEAPYAYLEDQWVGYDNRKSIQVKVNYLIEKGLGGAMVYSLNTDDFRRNCYGYAYPLLKVVASELKGDVFIPTSKPPTSTTEISEFQCTNKGYFRDPWDCSKFYLCVQKDSGFEKHTYSCGPDAAFDETTATCKHKDSIPGCI